MRQGTVEASTCGYDDASLIVQQRNRRLALVESLKTDARVCLDVIPSVDKTLRDFSTFAFITFYLFFEVGRHSPAVAELLCLIERL